MSERQEPGCLQGKNRVGRLAGLGMAVLLAAMPAAHTLAKSRPGGGGDGGGNSGVVTCEARTQNNTDCTERLYLRDGGAFKVKLVTAEYKSVVRKINRNAAFTVALPGGGQTTFTLSPGQTRTFIGVRSGSYTVTGRVTKPSDVNLDCCTKIVFTLEAGS